LREVVGLDKDNSMTFKAIVIIFIVVMGFSMIAGAFLMADRSNNSNPTTTDPNSTLPDPTATKFNYTLIFDSNAIKDLGSIKFAGMTNILDKSSIDSKVLKVAGVSSVTSQFKKTTQDANNWIYLADIVLKKSSDPSVVSQSIGDLNEFDKTQGFDAMKLITITVPASVMLHNVDLNIDRNYSFPTTTLSALAKMSTVAGDELVVSGSIQLQGTSISSINLIEEENKTQTKLYQEYLKQVQAQADLNKPLDTNLPIVDSNKQ
jgi:hypothetical protein